MSKVLFEITEDELDSGLRGFPIGYCCTSDVDPERGIFYVGKPVAELAHKQPEEVIYLLYHGKEATKEELQKFKEKLHSRSECSQEVIDTIQRLPKAGHPMKLFSAAILILAMVEKSFDYREDCLKIIAKIPHLTALVINYHAGWGETPKPKKDLGYIENFCNMLKFPGKKNDFVQMSKLFNIIHYDHGGGNLSTFVGKAVASGLEDMYGSIASAMLALAGPRHGRANQDCLEFVKGVLKQVGENADAKAVEKLLRDKLAKKELVFGFGHAVLRVEDPRAAVLYDYAKKNYAAHPLIKIAFLLREVGPKILKENPKIADPYPNIDAISGSVLAASGFDYPEYFTVLFGMSRVVGISIQIVYERCEARGGKGTPIVRPNYLYKPRD